MNDPKRQPDQIREIFVERTISIYAALADTEETWFTAPEGNTARARPITVTCLAEEKCIHIVTVRGAAEDGHGVVAEYWESADEYPPEIEAITRAIITKATAVQELRLLQETAAAPGERPSS